MYACNKCDKDFSSNSALQRHYRKKRPCKPLSHFCSICKKGSVSRRSLLIHKRKCAKREDASLVIDEQVKVLKKKLNAFLSQLNGDFESKLQELEKVLNDNELLNCDVEAKSET